MLNPSTADHEQDDPTIRRCIGYSRSCGAGSLVVTNLFALRATDPRELLRHEDPIGAENAHYLATTAINSDLVVCAWGNRGAYLAQASITASALSSFVDLHCLRVTKTGQPAHPLYLPAKLTPQLFREVAE